MIALYAFVFICAPTLWALLREGFREDARFAGDKLRYRS